MERLQAFITKFFYKEIKDKGFCYIADKDLFVIDDLEDIISTYDVDFKESKLTDRKKTLKTLIEVVNNAESFNEKPELKEKFIVLVEYQMFLDEKGYDNRFKRKVRELITKEFLRLYKDVKVVRDRYFYYPKRVEINFIDNLNNLITYLQKETKFYR